MLVIAAEASWLMAGREDWGGGVLDFAQPPNTLRPAVKFLLAAALDLENRRQTPGSRRQARGRWGAGGSCPMARLPVIVRSGWPAHGGPTLPFAHSGFHLCSQ